MPTAVAAKDGNGRLVNYSGPFVFVFQPTFNNNTDQTVKRIDKTISNLYHLLLSL